MDTGKRWDIADRTVDTDSGRDYPEPYSITAPSASGFSFDGHVAERVGPNTIQVTDEVRTVTIVNHAQTYIAQMIERFDAERGRHYYSRRMGVVEPGESEHQKHARNGPTT